jgi:hypothetical protein
LALLSVIYLSIVRLKYDPSGGKDTINPAILIGAGTP